MPAALLDPGPLPVIPPGRLDDSQKTALLVDTGAALLACRAKLGEVKGLVVAEP